MKKQHELANAMLWAAAILAAAVLGAPDFFSTILLPCLVATAMLTSGRSTCFRRKAAP